MNIRNETQYLKVQNKVNALNANMKTMMAEYAASIQKLEKASLDFKDQVAEILEGKMTESEAFMMAELAKILVETAVTHELKIQDDLQNSMNKTHSKITKGLTDMLEFMKSVGQQEVVLLLEMALMVHQHNRP